MDIFSRLDLAATALLLDVDGTLIDIGPSPHEVHVSDDLIDSLARLSALTGGALALVSGRPISDLDRLFAPLKLPAIGGHGAEIRLAAEAAPARAADLSEGLRRRLADAALLDPGIAVEDKGYSVALHYRRAPQQAERLRQHIGAARAAFPQETTQLLIGKALFEVKQPGVSKGEAVRELIKHPPFSGRTPVFLGDDVTDESVFEALPSIGGKGFGVGRGFPGLAGNFASPADVRGALQQLAARGRREPA